MKKNVCETNCFIRVQLQEPGRIGTRQFHLSLALRRVVYGHIFVDLTVSNCELAAISSLHRDPPFFIGSLSKGHSTVSYSPPGHLTVESSSPIHQETLRTGHVLKGFECEEESWC